MTETILKSILRLYALTAQLNKNVPLTKTRNVIESYLQHLVSQEKVNSYLIIFDFYFRGYDENRNELTAKTISVYSVKALIICDQINTILKQKEKALVLVNLFDLIDLNDNTPEETIDFIKTITGSFNFKDHIFYNCEQFVLRQPKKINAPEKVLVIAQRDTLQERPFNFLHKDFLSGQIHLLYITEIDTILFRYTGGEEPLYLNGRTIVPDRTYVFEKGASLRSPKLSPIYYSDINNKFLLDENEPKVTLFVDQARFKFNNSENGIYPFSLYEKSGSLIGIMGGSGVGKSTLLNVLNGNLKPAEGKILINGYNLYNEPKKLEGVIGYIPQDDLLIEELTVYQNLYFSAKLCFNDLSNDEIITAVEEVLINLDLIEIKDLKVGNALNKFISGGQRKRLNLALELIREPSILFVDEPTSGLSSHDSNIVMDLLKQQTKLGKLVIVNIHQPSSDIYKMFDKLLVLDKGGRLIYQGNPIDAIGYFKKQNQLINADESECLSCGNVNPEQLLQIIEDKEINQSGKRTNKRLHSPQEWYDLYKRNIEPHIRTSSEKQAIPKSNFSIPRKIKQFQIFLKRNVLSKLTDKQYLLINLLEAPVLAIILSFFTRYNAGTPEDPTAYIFSKNENLPVYMFMSVVVALFLGMMVSAEEIIKDKKILKREAFLNLSRSSYINSKIFLLMLISAIQTITFVAIGNTILEIKGMYFSYWLILFLTALFANTLGLLISASLKSVVAIYILIPVLLVPQLLLGGAMLKFDKLNKSITNQDYVPIIGDIMTSRWAYEALTVNQFMNNLYQEKVYAIEQKESEFSYGLNYYVPEIQNLINQVKRNFTHNQNHKESEEYIKTARKEIRKLTRRYNLPEFSLIDQVTINDFDINTANEVLVYLKQAKQFFSKQLQKSLTEKDAIFNEISKNTGRENLLEFKNKYFNESVSNIVLNKDETDKVIYSNGEFIQKAEPIFKIPVNRHGRSHFYSPVKRLGSFLYDTYWFNAIVILLLTSFIYIILLFNGIEKTQLLFHRLKANFTSDIQRSAFKTSKQIIEHNLVEN